MREHPVTERPVNAVDMHVREQAAVLLGVERRTGLPSTSAESRTG